MQSNSLNFFSPGKYFLYKRRKTKESRKIVSTTKMKYNISSKKIKIVLIHFTLDEFWYPHSILHLFSLVLGNVQGVCKKEKSCLLEWKCIFTILRIRYDIFVLKTYFGQRSWNFFLRFDELGGTKSKYSKYTKQEQPPDLFTIFTILRHLKSYALQEP